MDLSLFANDSAGACAGYLLNFYPKSSRKHNIFCLRQLVSALGIAPKPGAFEKTRSAIGGS
jgi:hypothetical protein